MYKLRRVVRKHIASVALVLLGLALLMPVQDLAALQFDESTVVGRARTQHGAGAASRVQSWMQMLDRYQSVPESDKLIEVNDFWNERVRGAEDIDIWKQEDYWATPVETLTKTAGDCEDFVIGKYFSLVHMGVDPEKLRFIYVRAQLPGAGSKGVAHMVLGYYSNPAAVPLVLDNLNGRILPASERGDLTPVFSFNASGIYVPGSAEAAPAERIGHWRGLLERMRQEGFEP